MENGYEVRPLIDEPDDGKKVLYLRHDIDYTTGEAVNLACVNAELGISGCFFLPVSSPIINLREEENRKNIQKIMGLGQKIGLHFYLPDSLADRSVVEYQAISDLITEEFNILEALVDGDIHPAMSWHNPGLLGESYSDWIQGEVPGLTNAYALSRKGVGYRADSNLRYSVDEWIAFAATEARRLQALFHPFQWSLGASRMQEILAEMFRRHIRQYDHMLGDNDVYSVVMPEGLTDETVDKLLAPLMAS